MPSRVLVLDGGTTQALACVRALGRAGHTVFVAAGRAALATWSRYCRGRYLLTDDTLPAFAALRAWAGEQGVQVVLPQTERSCMLCNIHRKEWEALGITVGCGSEDLLLRAFDKSRTWQVAEACGVRLPLRHVPRTLADGQAAAERLGYPVVIKPRFSHFWDGDRFLSGQGSRYAQNRAEVEASMRACRQNGYWPVIQEFIRGRGKGVFALYDHGRPLAWFAHERLRDVRPSGSGSSLRRSIPLDARLLGPAARLLSAWPWHGPAMVEFRDDGVSEPCLIEVNGRFWGSLELAIASGIDFPNLWLSVLRGEHPAPADGYAAGVTRRWWWGDVKRLLHILRGAPPGYPERFPGVLTGLREILGTQPAGTRNETWSKDDPAPALGEWVQGIGELVGDVRQRLRIQTPSPKGEEPVRVLMITSGWPRPGQPQTTHFIKRQAEFLVAAGVDVDVLHFRGARRPWNYALGWLRARRRLLFGRYDLVHAQFGQSGLLALPTRLPMVVTYRGSDLLGIVGPGGRYTRSGRILQWLTRLVARRADAVVVVSDHMKRHLPASVRATVLPSGLDFSLFQPVPRDTARRELGLAPERRLILFAGDPALPRKRYDLAKQAVDWLNRSMPAELVVAWGVPHTDMPRLMSACDVLVFTSMQEGSPNVVKEALACDLPVVSVQVGDVAERLRGIEGCELCPDERPETIAAALGRVLERGRRVAGREAVARLDETAITAQLVELYRSVLHPAPRDTDPQPATPLVREVPHAG
jgi:glycosyltransferase involved in cell wall biosynthesis/predicted ATP-grasp superfamily ATP-dependent carboligase